MPPAALFWSKVLEAVKAVDASGYSNKVINPFINFDKPCSICFCDANGRQCIVTSSGLISACGSVTSKDFPGSEIFIFGEVSDTGIHFSRKKYENLNRLLDAEKIEKCKDCFALYLCGGGCPSLKASGDLFWKKPTPYCDQIRRGTADYLWYLCEKSREEKTVI